MDLDDNTLNVEYHNLTSSEKLPSSGHVLPPAAPGARNEPPPAWEESGTPALRPQVITQTRWTAAELLDATFPEPKWAIPDLIPEGLSIIAGRPKVGKSWLLLQMAIATGTGGRFFGKPVDKGKVLYIGFEDHPRRLQDRIKKMGIPKDAQVAFEHDWRPLHKDGLNDLIIELAAVDYRMVIFDTLTRAFPGLSQKDRPEIIGQVIDNIQTIATNRCMSIVFSDHTRKPNGFDNDPIDDILYSSEKVKSADVVLALYKVQGQSGAKLLGRGRDIEDIDLSLQWDPETWCWQCKGNTDDVHMTEQETDVLDALHSFGRARMTDIAQATGINKGNVYRILSSFWTKRIVHKDDSGKDTYYEVLQP